MAAGLFVAVAGTFAAPVTRVTPVSDERLARIDVGGPNCIGGGGFCWGGPCVTPEPDCVDKNCFTNAAGQCEDWDDYAFHEDNGCTNTTPSSTCSLSDCAACYDQTICTPSSFACNIYASCWMHWTTCTTVTQYRYDDCN
jgi:hypothetical protein